MGLGMGTDRVSRHSRAHHSTTVQNQTARARERSRRQFHGGLLAWLPRYADGCEGDTGACETLRIGCARRDMHTVSKRDHPDCGPGSARVHHGGGYDNQRGMVPGPLGRNLCGSSSSPGRGCVERVWREDVQHHGSTTSVDACIKHARACQGGVLALKRAWGHGVVARHAIGVLKDAAHAPVVSVVSVGPDNDRRRSGVHTVVA